MISDNWSFFLLSDLILITTIDMLKIWCILLKMWMMFRLRRVKRRLLARFLILTLSFIKDCLRNIKSDSPSLLAEIIKLILLKWDLGHCLIKHHIFTWCSFTFWLAFLISPIVLICYFYILLRYGLFSYLLFFRLNLFLLNVLIFLYMRYLLILLSLNYFIELWKIWSYLILGLLGIKFFLVF